MRKIIIGAIAAVSAACAAAPATAEIAFTPNQTSFRSGWSGTLGFLFRFDGSSARDVADLGVFDFGSDGFTGGVQVGLWDGSGNLLRSATLAAGLSGDLEDSFRFAAITPFTLTPGEFYYVGAFQPSDTYGRQGSATFAPGVTFFGDRYSDNGTGFTVPTSTAGNAAPWSGGNFRFAAVAAPGAPAPLLGLGLLPALAGAGGLVAMRRRKAA